MKKNMKPEQAMKSNKFADLGATNYTSTDRNKTRAGRTKDSTPKSMTRTVRTNDDDDADGYVLQSSEKDLVMAKTKILESGWKRMPHLTNSI